MNKLLFAEEVGAAATGVLLFNQHRPRPERETAVSVVKQADGPYPHVNIQGFRRMSVQVEVIDDGGEDGAATIALEVTNGDPNDVDTPWYSLDSSGALDASSGSAADMLHATDMAYRYARVSWSAAAGTPTIKAVLVADC